MGCPVENQLGASDTSGVSGHQAIGGSISGSEESKEQANPATPPLPLAPLAAMPMAKHQSPPLPMSGVAAGVQEDSVFKRRTSTSATSIAAALIPDVGVEVDANAIPEADTVCFDSGLASPLVRHQGCQ